MLCKVLCIALTGATKLLTRLSLVAPMSVFACLGQEATPIRDAYIARLRSHVEVCCMYMCLHVHVFACTCVCMHMCYVERLILTTNPMCCLCMHVVRIRS